MKNAIVRKNLMTIERYSPYCGNLYCQIMPRTIFDGDQFVCHICGWRSEFPSDFINKYKRKRGLRNANHNNVPK